MAYGKDHIDNDYSNQVNVQQNARHTQNILQKLAFYSALEKGYDIDKPRNLAKSVTVE